MWDRTAEHLNSLRLREEKSAMWKHWTNHHDTEDEPRFSVKLVGSCISSTERQIKEALGIEFGKFDKLMNSKSEFGNNCIVRQMVRLGETVVDERFEHKNAVKNDVTPTENAEEISLTDFDRQFSQRRRKQRTVTDAPAAKRKATRQREPFTPVNPELRRPACKRQRYDR